MQSDVPLAQLYCRACIDGGTCEPGSRQLLLPLPLADPSLDLCPMLLMVLNLIILALNLLDAGGSDIGLALPSGRRPTGAQVSSLSFLHGRVARFRDRCCAFVAPSSYTLEPEACFRHFTGSSAKANPVLDVECLDVVSLSARIDPPVAFAGDDWAKFLFPKGLPAGVPTTIRCKGPYRAYVKLTARLVMSGKLGFLISPSVAAPVFAVGKKGTGQAPGRQREVWSGNLISSAARRPWKPRRLGNPGVFARLRLKPRHRWLFTKRDARCWFDQLQVPHALHAFLGRPWVYAQDIADAMWISPD